jgi:hypothetical protein
LAPNLPGYGVLDRSAWHAEEISRAAHAENVAAHLRPNKRMQLTGASGSKER